MRFVKRSTALILIFILLFSSLIAANADFDKSALVQGVFQINVVHSVEIPSLEQESYTVWTSAVCFAAGRDADGMVYLVTDASVSKPDRMYTAFSRNFLNLLAAEGVEASESDFNELIKVVKTSYYLVYESALIELSTVAQTVSNNILLLKTESEIETAVFSYAYADSCENGDIVHTFSLSGDELDGMVPANEDAYMNNWSFNSRSGEIKVVASIDDGMIACTMSDIEPEYANQGSALFDDNGSVIGLNLFSENSDQLMSLTSLAIMSILDQAGISYTINEKTSNIFSMKEAFLFLAVAVALIIVLVIVLIILHSKRKKLEEDDLTQLELEASRARAEYARVQNALQSQRTISAKPAPSLNTSETIRASSSSLPPVRPAPASYTSVMLTVLDGTMKGYSMNIDGKVTLGRDPEVCNVVFPSEAIAVSRRHCAITFNKSTGRVLLEDLSSSNGTYFPSGTRLIPGRLYALRNGDRFYLGLPENLIEVRMQ